MATVMSLPAVESLLAALDSVDLKRVFSSLGNDFRLKELEDRVTVIKQFLLQLISSYSQPSFTIEKFIDAVKDAVFEAEDLIDELVVILQLEKEREKEMPIFKEVRHFVSRRHEIFRKIQKVRERLNYILSDYHHFGIRLDGEPIRKRREETYAYVDEKDVVGRDEERESIRDLLLINDPRQFSCVSIAGMAGVGKTTLAQLVYNDDIIANHFGVRLWVCVSQEFGSKEILGSILNSLCGRKCDTETLEELQLNAQNHFRGKKCFIVLDDVWNESRQEWVWLRDFLFHSAGWGSRLLMTTRSRIAARVIGDFPMYELQGLSEANSWLLFKQVAFREQQIISSNLEKIWRRIVKKCANLPLCIRVIASFLYGRDEEHFWLSIADNFEEFLSNEGHVMPCLRLSFDHLSTPLKCCFICCGLFPENYVFQKERLVDLWLANGCFLTLEKDQRIEVVAEEYLCILSQRFFIEAAEVDSSGAIISYKIPPIMHVFAQALVGKEFSTASSFNERNLHFSVTDECSLLFNPSDPSEAMERVRTLLLLTDQLPTKSASKPSLDTIISRCQRLRLLDLQYFNVKELPKMVNKLVHLRCINLSNNILLENLPESFSVLRNLQVLRLYGCRSLLELPEDICKLVQLRHLDILGCDKLMHMPSEIGRLTNLHALTMFVVGMQSGIDKLNFLKPLVNLRGETTIKVGRHTGGSETEVMQGLSVLRGSHLKTLHIKMECARGRNYNEDNQVHGILLECLDPNPDIREINIMGYQGPTPPTWFRELHSLARVTLCCCPRLQHLNLLSQLHCLRYLHLKSLPNLEYLESENEHALRKTKATGLALFPLLEELRLEKLALLKGWWIDFWLEPEESRYKGIDCKLFPLLRQLHIKNCPKLVYPPLFYQKELNLRNKGKSPASSSNSSFPLMSSIVGCNISCHPNLEELKIQLCDEECRLNTSDIFPWCASSLREVGIYECDNLKSLCAGGFDLLDNLQHLSICSARHLVLDEDNTRMPWTSLKNLTSLTLANVTKLITFPSGFLQLTSLHSLQIAYCSNLTTLPEWLNLLVSLKQIKIIGCCQLRSLPEVIPDNVELEFD